MTADPCVLKQRLLESDMRVSQLEGLLESRSRELEDAYRDVLNLRGLLITMSWNLDYLRPRPYMAEPLPSEVDVFDHLARRQVYCLR